MTIRALLSVWNWNEPEIAQVSQSSEEAGDEKNRRTNAERF